MGRDIYKRLKYLNIPDDSDIGKLLILLNKQYDLIEQKEKQVTLLNYEISTLKNKILFIEKQIMVQQKFNMQEGQCQ